MATSNIKLLRVLVYGGFNALISGYIALIIFSLSDEILKMIENPNLQFNLTGMMSLIILAGLLALFPIIIAGMLLAYILYLETTKGQISLQRGGLIGCVLGAVVVLLISIGISVIALSTGKVPMTRLIELTIEATIPGALAGAWTGRRLAMLLSKSVRQGEEIS